MPEECAAFVVFLCTLHNLLIALVGELLSFYHVASQRAGPTDRPLLFNWPQEFWSAFGNIAGCFLGSILYTCLSTKLVLNSFRPFIVFWPAYYYLAEYWNFSLYRNFYMTASFLVQGIIEAISQIGVPLYVLNTHDGCVTPLIILTTQLPSRIAKVILYGVIYLKNFTCVFEIGCSSLFFFVGFLFLFAPKEESNRIRIISEKVDCIRALMVASGIALLTQLIGSDLYRFYFFWSLRPVLTENLRLISSGVITLSCFAAFLFSCCFNSVKFVNRTAVATNLIISGCLFMSGWIIKSTIFPTWLPSVLYFIFNMCYHFGLGSLYVPICAFLPNQRILIFTIVTLFHGSVGRLMTGGATATLIDYLQPFGAFWLHSSITFIGMIYIAFIVSPQLNYEKKFRSTEITVVQEFVTQV